MIDIWREPSDWNKREVAMTIRVELNPEMERKLAAEALARGIALELYAHRLIPGWNGPRCRHGFAEPRH